MAAAFNRIPDAMSSRFTHATVTAKSLSAPGLFNPLEPGAAAAAAKTEAQLKQEAEEKERLEQEKKQAAEGKIVHEVKDWAPEKLLCRRFNCPDPFQNRPKVASARHLPAHPMHCDNHQRVHACVCVCASPAWISHPRSKPINSSPRSPHRWVFRFSSHRLVHSFQLVS